MPRGRHRHSPSLHRLLPAAAVGAGALVCAGAAWLVGGPGSGDGDTVALRVLATAAALTGVAGATLARRWDRTAGRRVTELKARQASTEWRAEERQADLEGDLAESREVRTRLETRLRDKRAELARLRTEHAALLRRYAHAEAGRANALEGRRLLALEAAEPTRALTAGATDHRKPSGAPTPLTYLQADDALRHLKRNAERQAERRAAETARVERERAEAERRAAAPSREIGGFDFFGTGGAAPRGSAPAAGGSAGGGPEAEAEAEPGRIPGGPGARDVRADAARDVRVEDVPADAEPAPDAPHGTDAPDAPDASEAVDAPDEPAALDIAELRSAIP
ncbi:hypothetical protein [Streptomyces phytohabitans]|uniref:hypothetical protein n=1 Tax=Streptomyces phytohabitans TaxID=1150371 RepID=UPI00345C221C